MMFWELSQDYDDALLDVIVRAMRRYGTTSTRESADCCGISLRPSHKQVRFARVCAPGPQRKLLEQCCNSRQKLRGALRILDGAYQAREGAQLQQVRCLVPRELNRALEQCDASLGLGTGRPHEFPLETDEFRVVKALISAVRRLESAMYRSQPLRVAPRDAAGVGQHPEEIWLKLLSTGGLCGVQRCANA